MSPAPNLCNPTMKFLVNETASLISYSYVLYVQYKERDQGTSTGGSL